MVAPSVVFIGDGNKGKIKYYYWNEYESHEEALYYAREIKKEKRGENMNLKYFILESQEGWFLPFPKFVLYLSKKLRLI